MLSPTMVAGFLALCYTTAGAQTLSVCEALKHWQRYDGKLVSIRGRLGGGNEVSWLLADGCPDRLVTEGFAWPAVIEIRAASAAFRSRDGETQSPFRTDAPSLERARDELNRAGWRDGDVEVITVTGLFRVSGLTLQAREGESGEKVGIGVDGLGTPAYLVLKSVMDPEILRCARIEPSSSRRANSKHDGKK